jgi:hypothetical protein
VVSWAVDDTRYRVREVHVQELVDEFLEIQSARPICT